MVMHSATKYLNGHSDVVAGAVVAAVADARWDKVKRARAAGGAVLGAFEAWLLMRGMRTLHLRVKRQSESAMSLALRLRSHPAISHVLYPGLPDHPAHHVSAHQQSANGTMFGGMLSIRVHGGAAAVLAALALVRVWTPATSLGGVESLIEHRATVEGPTSGIPEDLLRLSVGLEDADDLFFDLKSALEGKRSKLEGGGKKRKSGGGMDVTGYGLGGTEQKRKFCKRGCKVGARRIDSPGHVPSSTAL